MTASVRLVGMDPALETWLLERLVREPPESAHAEELLDGVRDLLSGAATSLVLGNADAAAATLAAVTDELTAGELVIHPKSRKVLRAGVEVSLTPKEFDILYFLARNRGEVFTKEQIYRAVWERDYLLDDSNIMAFVRKLRKKIEPDPDAPRYILTIWGIGYKFTDDL